MWRCKSGQCFAKYTGEADSIYFWSKHTAIGDEIMHDLFRRMFDLNIHFNFSAFIQDMNRIYKSLGVSYPLFMSKSLIVDVAFGWLASMKIDFRKHIDPYCKHSPKILGCDATHVGPSLRHIDIDAIEKADDDIQISSQHQRYDRTFVTGTDSISVQNRHHLKYIVKKAIGEFDQQELLPPNVEQSRLLMLLSSLPKSSHYFNSGLANSTLSPESFSFSVLDLFKRLCTDAPLISLFPFASITDITRKLNLLLHNQNDQNALSSIHMLCGTEVQSIVSSAIMTHQFKKVHDFISDLVNQVNNLHLNDTVRNLPKEIPNSYNPATGVAYYFTESGNKVRNLPTYTIGTRPEKKSSSSKSGETCNKKYPRVVKGGYSHMFLWFCPIHGHSYGFHVIPGSEGRKDAFASLYRYLPEPPQHIFYDFACSLSEFSLNREPHYFRQTRFWIDLFHSYNHTCGSAYRSLNNPHLQINSEICEQFNAFLQRIKYVCTHLSIERFSFLVQYAIYKWNNTRTEAYEKRKSILFKCSE